MWANAANPVRNNEATQRPSEENERVAENQQVKDFINTLDSATIKKLCIRSLRRGIGSLDYIDSLLIMEDDLDNANDEDDIAEVHSPAAEARDAITPPPQPIPMQRQGPRPEWCVCGNCRNMPLEVEKVCCMKKNCDAKKPRFKLYRTVYKSSADIRNDRQNNSTRSFRKAAYRHYILDKHGYLGKGRRKVAASCVVWEIRAHYPSSTGIYMGFKER
ncbi:P2X purinoceptor 7-like [Montipora capricornis]|uniref:P2X purinoceptor 7-like n=1 Tax=Montipora capricornis TaxID=246305 RepID=UPI0035F18F0E